MENDTPNGSKTSYTLKAPDGTVLASASDIAGDTLISAYFNVEVKSADDTQGIVLGSEMVQQGDFVLVEAIAYDGYEFDAWYKNGAAVSEDPSYRFRVTEDVNLIAKFRSKSTVNTPSAPSGPSVPQNGPITADQNTTVSNTSKSESLSVKVENKITGKTSKATGVKNDDKVSVKVGTKNDGYYANIMTVDGEMIDSVEIKTGRAEFTLKDDVKFIIVIDSYSYIEDVSSGSYLMEDSSMIDMQDHSFIIVSLAALSTIMIFRRKRQK